MLADSIHRLERGGKQKKVNRYAYRLRVCFFCCCRSRLYFISPNSENKQLQFYLGNKIHISFMSFFSIKKISHFLLCFLFVSMHGSTKSTSVVVYGVQYHGRWPVARHTGVFRSAILEPGLERVHTCVLFLKGVKVTLG